MRKYKAVDMPPPKIPSLEVLVRRALQDPPVPTIPDLPPLEVLVRRALRSLPLPNENSKIETDDQGSVRRTLTDEEKSYLEACWTIDSLDAVDAINAREKSSASVSEVEALSSLLSRIHEPEDIADAEYSALTLPPLPDPGAFPGANNDDRSAVLVEKMFCFGMIPDIAVQLLDGATNLCSIIRDNSSTPDLYHFRVVNKGTHSVLQLRSGETTAVFNEAANHLLKNLSNLPSCKFEAYAPREIWQEVDFNTREKQYLLVDIVVYGLQRICGSVGKEVSAFYSYLQHPTYQLPDTEYDNPHFLKFTEQLTPDSPSSTLANNFSLQSRNGHDPQELIHDKDIDLASRGQMRKIEAIMSSLTRSKHLRCLEADIRIRTSLLPHQMEALDFMSQREFGPLPAEYSLWARSCHGQREFFEHRITGLKKSSPSVETGGGILADDMGLGKTLMVIATIIRTTKLAETFAATGENSIMNSCLHTKSKMRNSRSTLVLVPSTLLLQGWIEEIQRHCDGSLQIEVYHGRDRFGVATALVDSDIVLTTYHTMAAEALNEQFERPLYQINWFRIVLDEAHYIRRMTTNLYKAASMLSGKIRWCLTGTPVQNKLEDIASLVAFIRIPFLDNLQNFRKHIIHPLIKNEGSGSENLRIFLDSICLRRESRLLALPEMKDEYRLVEFSEPETLQYRQAFLDMKKEEKQSDTQARNTKGYFGIFQLQLQLCRLCNHGTFQIPPSAARGILQAEQFDSEEAFALLQEINEANCAYCSETITELSDYENKFEGYFSLCGHLLCSACKPKYRASLKKVDRGTGFQCSLCPQRIARIFTLTKSSVLESRIPTKRSCSENDCFKRDGISSKMKALITDIQQSCNESKSIVFSCWTKSLDLAGLHLDSCKVRFVRIDGSHTLSHRQKILEEYHSDPSIRVLLMTTGTGAVGLNLTIANQVYILEPQWNPW